MTADQPTENRLYTETGNYIDFDLWLFHDGRWRRSGGWTTGDPPKVMCELTRMDSELRIRDEQPLLIGAVIEDEDEARWVHVGDNVWTDGTRQSPWDDLTYPVVLDRGRVR